MPDLSAEGTPSHNPGIRHGAHRRRNILSAFLAADREVALAAFREVEHECKYRRRKGETSIIRNPEFSTHSAAKKLIG